MSEHVNVPQSVALVYRVVGDTHVFTSKAIRGLLYVASHDRETAFHDVIPALNKHIAAAYSCEASYKCAMDYTTFISHVDAEDDILGNFLELELDAAA